MKKLLQTLTETFGPSGYEDKVREIVRREVQPLADELRVDALGNLIAHKRPTKNVKEAKKIMIAAHMDEIGVMVSHVDRKGFVRFSPLGNVHRKYVLGSRVRFRNGTRGVIGASSTDHPDHADELPAFDKFYIDVGATSQNDCPVQTGDVAVFDQPYHELGACLVAKSISGRVGVLVAIETLRKLKSVPHDIIFVFTTQAEVGRRGAVTSAYGVDPDIGIALGATPVEEAPHSHGIALGHGPCIRIQDASMIADTRIVDWMISAAEKGRLPYQREVLLTGNTDAGRIQLVRAGVLSGCISIPVRYLHSPSEMVDYSDVQNAARLLTAVLHTPLGL